MIEDFTRKFVRECVGYERVGDSYYYIPNKLKKIKLNIDPIQRGLFLGEEKKTKFIPSLVLLEMINKTSKEKLIVKDIGEMDFLYGKDLRKRHIKKVEGEKKVGFLKLVVNEKGDNLGYGKIIKDLDSNGVVFKNILDRGDYLRREK